MRPELNPENAYMQVTEGMKSLGSGGHDDLDFESAYMQLTEGMQSLRVGGNDDAVNTVHGVPIETFNRPSIIIDNSETNGKVAGCTPMDKNSPHHWFIRISPVALDVSDIGPNFDAQKNFQLVSWKSPEGHIETRLSYDIFMQLVDPRNDADYIVLYLLDYMAKNGKGLFLYVRVPENGVQPAETEECIAEICALLMKFHESFEVMDLAYFPAE